MELQGLEQASDQTSLFLHHIQRMQRVTVQRNEVYGDYLTGVIHPP